MSDETSLWDPKQLVVTVFGLPITGLAEDGIKVESVKEKSTVTQGLTGNITFNVTNSRLKKVTITLTPGATDGTLMAVLSTIDTIGPLTITNLNGTELLIGASYKFTKDPDWEFKAERNANSWELQGNADVYLGA